MINHWNGILCSAKVWPGENFDKFSEWSAIRQNFSFQPFFSLLYFSNGGYCKIVKILLAKFPACLIHQHFTPSKFCAIRYNNYTSLGVYPSVLFTLI